MKQSITKIDLHLHSNVSCKIGDVVGWNSINNTLNKIRNNDIEIISFTDHDHFSTKFYKDVINEIKKENLSLTVLPGIEISVLSLNSKQKGHALFIFNNNINENKLITLEKITNKIRTNYVNGIKLFTAIKMYSDYEFVIIPHIGKGSDNLIWKDLECVDEFIHNIESKSNSFLLKKFYKDSKLTNIKPILFSDCHDWVKMNDFKWTGAYIDGEFNFEKIKQGIKQYDKLH